ncbi:MAG: trypsin-like serine protease [Phycisphaerae bacterium]
MTRHSSQWQRAVLVVILCTSGVAAWGATPASDLIALHGLVTIAGGMGVYINPYAAAGQHLARRVQIAEMPAVGGVPIPGTGGDCTGTLLLSNTWRSTEPDFWILTAGHCVGDAAVAADNGRSFRPRGRFGPDAAGYADGINLINPVTSDRVRRHPDYDNTTVANDVALLRLSPANDAERQALLAAGTGRSLLRIPAGTGPADGTAFVALGVGNANAVPALGLIPAWGGGYGDKRLMISSVTNRLAATNHFEFHSGQGTVADRNPIRHLCPGDSGGPSFFAGDDQIGGVHSYVSPDANCNGTTTLNVDANVTVPFLYNYLDSYTRRSIFWDRLTINGTTRDTFEFAAADRGKDGTAPNWATANNNTVTHPAYGLIGPNAGWRYMSAIGTDRAGNPELFVDDDLGTPGQQGSQSQGEIMTTGGPSLIRREFNVQGGGQLDLTVQQRWNSIGLLDDMGVCVVNTADAQRRCVDNTLVWNGLAASGPGNLDAWFTRVQAFNMAGFPGAQTIAVYLLNVPEPSALGLLAIGMGLAGRLRRARR